MYLSNLKLWNFRKFGHEGDFDLASPDVELPLKNGLNVLIGENDSGKSAIIDAIRLTLGTHSPDWSRITREDFYRDSTWLRIELTFSDLAGEEAKNFVEWLSIEGKPPNCYAELRVNWQLSRTEEKVVPSDLKAGADADGHPLTAEAREYLKTTYLRPLRDAKAELVAKKNSRLSQILLGHELFKGREEKHPLKLLLDKFNTEIEEYFEVLPKAGAAGPEKVAEGLKLKQEIDRYLASFYGEEKKTTINAEGGSLRAILEKLEISLRDEINPGLGTLNRLFMASELVHLNKANWHGLRLCLIEELEAHLHPQAQMQVIEALQREPGIQTVLTTHSPNLASKVRLDSLIICGGAKVFPMGRDQKEQPYTELEPDDHQFLEWFLDTTKANLFFARGVMLVEGWSEELILPALARAMKKAGLIKRDLTEAQVSIVNVGGTSHLRYARIFARKAAPQLGIPVAVVTDSDIPCWAKAPAVDADGKVVQGAGGKVTYSYSHLPDAEVKAETDAAIAGIRAKFDRETIKSFVAPRWTLEYCLLSSPTLSNPFRTALKKVHPHVEPAAMEMELAQKLLNGSLDKTALANEIALVLDADAKLAAPTIVLADGDAGIGYLMEAIRHASRA
jgi:putative ATP-dependent endonuclease of OLD family